MDKRPDVVRSSARHTSYELLLCLPQSPTPRRVWCVTTALFLCGQAADDLAAEPLKYMTRHLHAPSLLWPKPVTCYPRKMRYRRSGLSPMAGVYLEFPAPQYFIEHSPFGNSTVN